jgi:hypothetical protein
VIVFHGDRDDVVHPGNGDAVLRQFVAHAPNARGETAEMLRFFLSQPG